MTQTEANLTMLKMFEELADRSQKENLDNKELVEIADSAHRLYITLTNAKVFVSAPSNEVGSIN